MNVWDNIEDFGYTVITLADIVQNNGGHIAIYLLS